MEDGSKGASVSLTLGATCELIHAIFRGWLRDSLSVYLYMMTKCCQAYYSNDLATLAEQPLIRLPFTNFDDLSLHRRYS